MIPLADTSWSVCFQYSEPMRRMVLSRKEDLPERILNQEQVERETIFGRKVVLYIVSQNDSIM